MRMTFNAHFSSFEPRKPLENLCTAQYFLLKGPLKHFMCFCVRFSETETISQAVRCSVRSDITISQQELDNTWENWQHKPVQFSMATSTWLLTHEGCNYTHPAGEHSTTIRKRSRKPVRFFWVLPRILLCYLWLFRLYRIFPHHLINGAILGKMLLNIKYVLRFPTNFVWSILHSKNNAARYWYKVT